MPHERFDDDQAHQRAERYLASVLGADCAGEVCWDGDHHLQGHLDHSGEHLVVIAPRDDEHDPIVMSETEWDACRRGQRLTYRHLVARAHPWLLAIA
jgi:hypothetical protein